MCLLCGVGAPACAIDGNCSTAMAQNLKIAMVAAGPLAGSTIWWINNKKNNLLTKQKKKNDKKL